MHDHFCKFIWSVLFYTLLIVNLGSEGEVDRRRTGGDGLTTTDLGKVPIAEDDKFDGLMNSTQLQLMKDNNKRLIGMIV